MRFRPLKMPKGTVGAFFPSCDESPVCVEQVNVINVLSYIFFTLKLTELFSEIHQILIARVYHGGTCFVKVSTELYHASPTANLAIREHVDVQCIASQFTQEACCATPTNPGANNGYPRSGKFVRRRGWLPSAPTRKEKVDQLRDPAEQKM